MSDSPFWQSDGDKTVGDASPPLRVLFLVMSFFPQAKGACYAAVRLAGGLRCRGVSISFATNDLTGWRDGEAFDGFPVRTFFFKGSGMGKKARAFFRFIGDLRSGVIPAELVHIHGGGHMPLLAARLIQMLLPQKVIFKITLNGWDTPDGIRKLKWSGIVTRAFMDMDAVVAMTSGQAKTCREQGYQGTLRVIPNSVEIERFRPVSAEEKTRLREALQLTGCSHWLLYAGVLDRRKGTDLLLEAYAALAQKHSRLGLMLVGDFVQESLGIHELLQQVGIEKLDLPTERIRKIGRVDDVERYMQAADLFVFPSRQEGFGTVQIEAMACGLPCVVGRIPGVTEDIFPDSSFGEVVETYEAEKFVEAIERLLKNPLRMEEISVAARKRAVDTFSVERISQQYHRLYRDLLGKE